ncbi:MAG: EAL domain-containing protein [Telmatospirillum sp.]|nr:EAL domain-containing protein [Telmatospirillum sp.]
MDRWSPRGIKAWLLLLSLFSAIPIFLFSGFTLYRLAESEEEALVATLVEHARAMASLVAERVEAVGMAAQVLARSDAAVHGDIRALRDHAVRLQDSMPEIRDIVLIDGTGRALFSTAVSPADVVALDIARDVIRTGRRAVSDLYALPPGGVRVVSVNLPVTAANGAVFCLSLALSAESLSHLLEAEAVPLDGTVALLGATGTILARNRASPRFVGAKTSSDVLSAVSKGRGGVFDSVTYDGVRVKAASAPVGATGWTVVFGAPMAVLNAKLDRTLWTLSIGGALLMLSGMLASLWIAGRLAGRVARVADASAAFGDGDAAPMPHTGIRELDAGGAALGEGRAREERVQAELTESRSMEAMLARAVEDLRRSKAEVEEQSERSKALLKVASDGIHILDHDGRLREASESFLRMLGYDADEAAGLSIRDWEAFFAPDRIREWVARMIEEGSSAVFETRFRRRDGSVFPVEISCRGVSLNGASFLYAAARDITERKAAQAKIEELAFFDSLTRLPNWRLLLERLSQARAICQRTRSHGALCFIDVDNFKTLNDTRGHRLGDLLLGEMAGRLKGCVGEGDTVARSGGDEFVVLLENLPGDPAEAALAAEQVVEKILQVLAVPYHLESQTHYSTVSIGVTLFHTGEVSNDDLLKQADLAMYQAKAAGRNTRRFFDPAMQADLAAQSGLETDLRRSVGGDRLFLHYQPQIDRAGRLVGAEGLLRWSHPDRGLVLPGVFIPLAESSDLILSLGRQVLEEACATLARWNDDPEMRDLVLAVNVSARQFRHPHFADDVRAILRSSGADPTRLKLELTESLLLQEVEDCVRKMVALERLGVSLSLDDFGTGYSSLAYLKRLPLSQIKIDRSFVRDILTDSNDATIARTVIVLGKSMGLDVIAEGVEEPGQWDFLLREGCDKAQGFLFGRPMPAADFVRFAHRHTAPAAVGAGEEGAVMVAEGAVAAISRPR